MTISSSFRENPDRLVSVWPLGHPGTTGHIRVGRRVYRCALGRSGVAAVKREGDGATPLGVFPVRRVHYRSDRLPRPRTGVSVRALGRHDGWCDAPDHPAYNRLIRLPFQASHEVMLRDDHLYDVVLELGYNDDPPRPGCGSAIFLHLAREGYRPTEGCVAVTPATMRAILKVLGPDTRIAIGRTPSG